MFFLQGFKLTRLPFLLFQMTQTLLVLLQYVLQPAEVLFGAANPVLSVPATFSVQGNPGGFLNVFAHLIGFRLDQPLHHALGNDGVITPAKSGALEQVGDILAADMGAVDVVAGLVLRFAGDFAADPDFAEIRVFASDPPEAVVDDNFDRSLIQTLPGIRAVEDDVVESLAPDVAGAFAENPADGIDDVGLAASVGADHTGQRQIEDDSGRLYKRLEPGHLDAGQAHLRLALY